MALRRTTELDYLDAVGLQRFHLKLYTGIGLAQILDGFEVGILSFAIPGIIRDLQASPGVIGVVAALQNLGLLVGALVAGHLADRIGRRWPFTFALVLYPLGALLSALAPNVGVLMLGRFIGGLGIGGQWPVTFTLVAEFTPTKWRSKAMPGMLLGTSIGLLLASLVGVFVIVPYGWRLGIGLGVIPALLAIWVRMSCPESVRYLLNVGRVEQARNIVCEIAAQAGDQLEFVDQPAAAPPQVLVAAVDRPRASIAPYLGTLIALTTTIFFFNISGYGAQTWVPSLFIANGVTQLQSFQLVFLSSLLAPVFATVLAAGTMDLGRERRFSLGVIGIFGGLAFAGLGVAFITGSSLAWVVVAQTCFGIAYSAVNSIYYTLGTELFPTRIRGKGVAYATGIGRLGAVVGPPLIGVFLGVGISANNVIFLAALPMVIGGVISLVFLRRPTKDMSLEQASMAVPVSVAARS